MKNDKNELVLALKNEIFRLKKIEKMSEEERAPYAAGIKKLHQRIDELRKATGMTSDGFVARMRTVIGVLEWGQISTAEFYEIESRLTTAQEAWRDGDAAKMETEFLKVWAITNTARTRQGRQEALI